MGILAFAMVLGDAGEIEDIVWGDTAIQQSLRQRMERKGLFDQLVPEVCGKKEGEIILEGMRYAFLQLRLPTGQTACLFFADRDRESLLAQALELVGEGVQIYDRAGYLIYCNRASRRISTIPQEMDIIGRHMLDIWNVNEEKSASLSCMKAGSPVKNRVDTFPSVTAGEVTTVNTAYPLSENGAVKGAVLFERDVATIEHRKNEIDTMLQALKDVAGSGSAMQAAHYTFEHIIGGSTAMRTAVELARKFARVECHILLCGETGTGKEMFAQSIHRESGRSQKNFVAINCAALPETLIESMLFGTAKGAFTGSENKAGLFEEANGGTLFLDELNSMSLITQSKILRVVQDGIYRRIGGNKDLSTDMRIISATNEDPFALVESGKMRRDLFYRLSSVQIQIPPLRARLEDLELLIGRYIAVKKQQFAKAIDYVAPQVLTLLEQYAWPGNVRELFHVLDYAMNVMEGGVIDISCLPAYFTEKAAPTDTAPDKCVPTDILSAKLANIMGDYEALVLQQVLEHHGFNISRAAAALGICRQSLSYRIHKYGIRI